MKLLWLDLETTGLDPEMDSILEIAIREADLSRPFDTRPLYHCVLYYKCTFRTLDPFVVEMHTKNGLLSECAKSSVIVDDVEDELLALVPEMPRDDRPVLAGSSIHFDHDFLKAHMPRFATRLSHRHYDVSAIKLFCQSLGAAKWPKAEAHRATADVVESITHAKACADWLNARDLNLT